MFCGKTDNAKLHVRHCEELIREDWKRLMGNLPIEDIPLPQNHIRKTIGG
ncbi:unnamed protein product [Tenebrio molitor]|nr:unnamed protein product [Tenebrio molitor]